MQHRLIRIVAVALAQLRLQIQCRRDGSPQRDDLPLGVAGVADVSRILAQGFDQPGESGIQLFPARPREQPTGRLADRRETVACRAIEWTERVVGRLAYCGEDESMHVRPLGTILALDPHA